jgi:uncharacterized protein
MTQRLPDDRTDVVDAGVFPQMAQPDELRDYMPEPWKSRALPPPHGYQYFNPNGEYFEGAWPPSGVPGSDPKLLARDVLNGDGADFAILTSTTRGLLPDADLANAVCRGTNEWLARRWLEEWNERGRYRGSIRVNPGDPTAAVEEIEYWAPHPLMLQIAVPLEALQPYGKRHYLPVWEAAARHGLPVYVRSEGGSGLEFAPTSVGYSRHYVEYSSLYPWTMFYHLSSLIAEGVFERLPNLRVIFGDGGSDFVMPLMWRMDSTWRATRLEMPRARSIPSSYLREHVRFTTQAVEVPPGLASFEEWCSLNDVRRLQLFASGYPFASFASRRQAERWLPSPSGHQVLGANAREIYGARWNASEDAIVCS